MGAYTKINLKEIEPGGTGEVEARFARKHLDSEHLGVSLFRYGSSYRTRTGHSHREQEEVYVVLGGSGRVKLDDEVIELKTWDAVPLRRARSAPSRVGRTGWSCSQSGPTVPREATESASTSGGRTRHLRARGVHKLDRHAAASSYSWMRPPSRSRRST